MRQSSSEYIRVLVSDDTRVHTELLADALKRDGGLQVTTSAAGSEGLISRPDLRDVDVLVLSSTLDGQPGRGFEVLRGLQASHGDVLSVMLLDSSSSEMILAAFRAGARGVFSKQESVDSLSKCVRRVHEGQIWANSQQMGSLVQALASSCDVIAVDARGLNLLSKRETEIVRCAAQGLTNREIAERLGLSPHTVKNSLFRIFDKLGVSSRIELLFMTLRQSHHAQSLFQYFLKNQLDRSFLDDATLVACQQAAEGGGLVAQLALAQFYAVHGSSPNDAVDAYMWFTIASEQMSKVCTSAMSRLTVDQLAQAERMASDWLSRSRNIARRENDDPPISSHVSPAKVSAGPRPVSIRAGRR